VSVVNRVWNQCFRWRVHPMRGVSLGMLLLLVTATACGAEKAPTSGKESGPSEVFLQSGNGASFVPNAGQFAPDVEFSTLRGKEMLIVGRNFLRFVTLTKAANTVSEQGYPTTQTAAEARPETTLPAEAYTVELRWQGANEAAIVHGTAEQQVRYSFLVGDDPTRWRTGLTGFDKVEIQQLYQHIDLVVYEKEGHFEFDYVIHPGADPAQIRWKLTGSDVARVLEDGRLVIESEGGSFALKAPAAHQEKDGKQTPVEVRYRQLEADEWGLQLGDYDFNQILLIDPVLHYSTFYGSTQFDQANALAVDTNGNSYIVGETWSLSLLVHPTSQIARRDGKDAFVLEMNSSLDGFASATYFGGNGDDVATSIALAGGDILIGGETTSSDLPGTTNGYQKKSGGGLDGFVARLKLHPQPSVVATTYLGGFGSDRVNAIARDVNNNVYVAGYTSSSNFPIVTPSFGPNYQGGLQDAFVAKLNGALSSMSWSGIHGGLGADNATALALGAGGVVWVTGTTSSSLLPAVNAFQSSLLGSYDCFVARIAANGASLTYSSYVGGLASENCYAIAVDSDGSPVIAGASASADFPATPGAFQVSRAGSYDNILFKLNPANGTLSFATYLGGSQTEAPTSLYQNPSGHWCLAGYTLSTNFPMASPLQSTLGGSLDGYYSCLNANASQLVFSTYLGGSEEDRITGAMERTGSRTFLTGLTQSTNFPVTSGSLQTTSKGNGDAFLSVIDRTGPNKFPVNVSVEPSMGTTETAHLTYTVEDANGYEDIRYIYTLIHNVVSAQNGCYVRYDADAHDLRLLSDDGLYWAGVAAPGENKILQNSQCKIDASKSMVWGHGIRMSLTIDYSFQPGFGGSKSLLVYSQDRPGAIVGWQLRGGWVVPALAGNIQPSMTYFMPNSGTFPSNAFVMQVTDQNGATDIANVDFLVNSSMSYGTSCYVRYNRSANRLQLLNDGTSQFLGSLTPGAAGSVENSKCVLSGSASAASQSGNVLTLVIYLGFKTLAAGSNSMWTLVSDQSNSFLGWKLQGTITVPIGPTFAKPAVQAASLGRTGSYAATLSVTAYDENGGSDIRDIYALVNGSMSYPAGCFVLYRSNTNEVYLLNDAGSGWQGVGTLGTGALANSQCSLNLALGTATSTTDTKTLTIPVTFQSSFAGAKKLYAYIEDQATLVSGWQDKGNYTIPFP